jgi:hypothetical protein
MAQRPAAAFAREIGAGESQNRRFMSFLVRWRQFRSH